MFIVTDLTRFRVGNPDVCTALVEVETGRCVRPMPYFTYELMRQHNVLPGAKFSGEFTPSNERGSPHWEDCDYSGLHLQGPATSAEFEAVLSSTMATSIGSGFQFQFSEGQKVIPAGRGGCRSITTIEVRPQNVEILPDQFNDQKIKISFIDGAGQRYRYLPITDLGFYDYAVRHRDRASLEILNNHIRSSRRVLLRVGLSRVHQQGGRNGYWLQVNGIYTFPSKLAVVRGYE